MRRRSPKANTAATTTRTTTVAPRFAFAQVRESGGGKVTTLVAFRRPSRALSLYGRLTLTVLLGRARLDRTLSLSPGHGPMPLSYPLYSHCLYISADPDPDPDTAPPPDLSGALGSLVSACGGPSAVEAVVAISEPDDDRCAGPASCQPRVRRVRGEDRLAGDHFEIDAETTRELGVPGVVAVSPSDAQRLRFSEVDPEVVVEACEAFREARESQQERGPWVVAVVGPRKAGKSCFCRGLANALMEVGGAPHVTFVETDVGQSEFTAPGIVSGRILKSGLAGPALSHHGARPDWGFFFGASIPEESSTARYLGCVEALMEAVRGDERAAGGPVVVNTQGWATDVGYKVTLKILQMCRVDFVVQMLPADRQITSRSSAIALTPQDLSAVFRVSPKGLPEVRDVPAARSRPPLPFFHSRLPDVALLASLRDHVNPVARARAYEVPWSSVALGFVGCVVAPSQSLYAVNGTLVGLCSDPASAASAVAREGCPTLLTKPPVAPVCVGLGLVRAVDTERKLYHIVCPGVPRELLAKVDVILRSPGLDLPVNSAALSFVNVSGTLATAPYLAVDTIADVAVGDTGVVRLPSLRRRKMRDWTTTRK